MSTKCPGHSFKIFSAEQGKFYHNYKEWIREYVNVSVMALLYTADLIINWPAGLLAGRPALKPASQPDLKPVRL